MADRDRLADRRQPQGNRAAADQGGLAHRGGARLRRAGARRAGRAGAGRGRGRDLHQAAHAARHAADAVGRRRPLRRSYLSAYPGYYLTGDGGYVDEDGYLYVMGRTDDVLNVAGHRLSTGALEAALAGHEAVAECAVIGVHDDLKGQVPRGLVVLKSGIDAASRGRADQPRARRPGALGGRRGGGPAPGRHRGRPAQDPLGQDPAQDDARDGRRQDADRAGTIEDPAVLEALASVLRPGA